MIANGLTCLESWDIKEKAELMAEKSVFNTYFYVFFIWGALIIANSILNFLLEIFNKPSKYR